MLTCRRPGGIRVEPPFKRLPVSGRFSASSMAALRRALSMAKESDARLTIMHVLEWQVDDNLLTDQLGEATAFRRKIEDLAKQQLDAAISADDRTWCRPRTRLAYGKPYDQILATAEEDEADLIVIGVHGRNAFDVLLFRVHDES